MSSHEYKDEYKDESAEDSNEEVFSLSNLITFFKKSNITASSIFTFDGRTLFVLVTYIRSAVELLIYIPSKFTVKPDRNAISLNQINMKMEEEDDELFHTAQFERSERKKNENSLKRLVGFLSDGSYKLAIVKKTYMSFVNRHNDVESYTFTNPYYQSGMYFIVDLENFYNYANRLDYDLLNFEQLFTNKLLSNIDIEVNTTVDLINKVYKDMKGFSSRNYSKKYSDRIRKVNDLISKKGNSEVYQLMSAVRIDNLKKLVYYENIINFFKEIKDI